MNINFRRRVEHNGTFTVIVTFSDVRGLEQAVAAENLIKRALLEQGAAGIIGDNPLEPKK